MKWRLSRKIPSTPLVLCFVLSWTASPAEKSHLPRKSHEGTLGQKYWGELYPTYTTCAAGDAQSRVDSKLAELASVRFEYNSVLLNVMGDAHTTYASENSASANTAIRCEIAPSSLQTTTEFADQFSGSDASAKIAAALTALPLAGGIVDARNLSDSNGRGSTVIDPGPKSVTILLGPYTYNFSQVIMRTNLHVIGQGVGQGLGGRTKPPTIIQATGGDSTPPFVLAQTAKEGQEDIILRGFRIYGTPGNTRQNALQIIAGPSGGLWYSEFDDIMITGFAGISLDFEATNTTDPQGINQFSTFKRIVVARAKAGSYALEIRGFNNSLSFEDCQFDGTFTGTAGGDGLTNILITEDVAGISFPPSNIRFDSLTTQNAGVAVQINAGDVISIDQGHFEADWGAVQLGTTPYFGSLNITIQNSSFFNETGIHRGSGFILKNTGATPNVSAAIVYSHSYQRPDNFLAGNTGAIVSYGNVVGGEGSYTFLPTQPAAPIAGPFASSTSLSSSCTVPGGIGTTAAVTCLRASVEIPSTGGPFRILASYALFATSSTSPNGIDTWVQDDTTNCSGGNCSWASFEHDLSAAKSSEIAAMMSEISPTTYAAGSGTITVNLNAQCNHSGSSLTAVSAAQNGPVASHLYLEVVPSN
jgi:hypothetical protein